MASLRRCHGNSIWQGLMESLHNISVRLFNLASRESWSWATLIFPFSVTGPEGHELWCHPASQFRYGLDSPHREAFHPACDIRCRAAHNPCCLPFRPPLLIGFPRGLPKSSTLQGRSVTPAAWLESIQRHYQCSGESCPPNWIAAATILTVWGFLGSAEQIVSSVQVPRDDDPSDDC